MLSRSATAKLKAILVVDILIVSIAAGSYLYLQAEGLINTAPVAEFTLSNLTINPLQVDIGEPLTITVNLTNVGTAEGTYVANLTVNDVLK
jgi:cyanate permease